LSPAGLSLAGFFIFIEGERSELRRGRRGRREHRGLRGSWTGSTRLTGLKTSVDNDQAIVEEAISILLERMPASKVARLCAAWQLGRGELKHRENLFKGESVDSLLGTLKDGK
jgi:hypothetical protein